MFATELYKSAMSEWTWELEEEDSEGAEFKTSCWTEWFKFELSGSWELRESIYTNREKKEIKWNRRIMRLRIREEVGFNSEFYDVQSSLMLNTNIYSFCPTRFP